jgi:hypothetical protein
VLARVAVDDVDGADLVVELLLRVGAEDVRHARIEAAAQHRHQALGLVLVVIGPLPLVGELGFLARLVVGRIHVVHARLQARVHDGQVLVGQRHVDDEVRLHSFDERDRLANVVGIDLRDVDRRLGGRLHLPAAL